MSIILAQGGQPDKRIDLQDLINLFVFDPNPSACSTQSIVRLVVGNLTATHISESLPGSLPCTLLCTFCREEGPLTPLRKLTGEKTRSLVRISTDRLRVYLSPCPNRYLECSSTYTGRIQHSTLVAERNIAPLYFRA